MTAAAARPRPTPDPDLKPTRDLAALLARAAARRAPLAGTPETTAYRLLHGAGDGLPGFAVDRLGPLLVVHRFDARADPRPLLDALMRLAPDAAAIYLRTHPVGPARLRPEEVAELAPAAPARGEGPVRATVRENGVAYEARLDVGLSYGVFLDMREPRAWLRGAVAGKTVLNLFAYTCAFGVCASLGGATRALNLDLSRPALAWGQDNYRLNGLEPLERDFVYGDAFDWLERFARRGERFDVVILDPPSFSTARGRRFAAERDYARLVAAALAVTAERGTLLAATNHAGILPARFDAILRGGVAESGRRAREQHRWSEPALDFPRPPGQAPYLKVRALRLDA